MASTRNNNTCGNYRLQQRNFTLANEYINYENSQYGHAYRPRIPVTGVTPSKMPWDTLTSNPVDVETTLLGIGSTDLHEPRINPLPEFKKVDEVSYFERLPVFMPNPLVIVKDQRPYPIPQ